MSTNIIVKRLHRVLVVYFCGCKETQCLGTNISYYSDVKHFHYAKINKQYCNIVHSYN